MFIGVSMQLQAVFKYFLSHTVGRLPLKKKKKKKKKKFFFFFFFFFFEIVARRGAALARFGGIPA